MKKIIKAFIITSLIISILQQPFLTIASGTNLVYLQELKESKTVTSGLIYERKQKLTNLGWVDIYVLKMDLNNENVDLDIIRSIQDWSKKNSLTSIMAENNSIAAVNASFFDTAMNPSDIIGAEYENGQYSYLKENYNKTTLGAGSLMVETNGNVFFSYLSANITVKNNNGKGIYITAINGVSDFVNSVVINQNAMVNTSQIENKANLYKIVVENDVVTEIVEPKVAARVPENGYVVTVNETIQDKIIPFFQPGTPVELSVKNNFGERAFQTILSGGGTILNEGQVVQTGMIVQPNSRHPRTAIGVTKDGNYLISMVVDGRGISIGATHRELANYLLEYNVYNAIHMDGGGSSTIAAREGTTNTVQLLNLPSDGSQRKVVNGLGFVSTAPAGTLNKIEIISSTNRVFKDSPITYKAVGYDEFFNPVTLNPNSLVWGNEGLEGIWKGSTFTPSSSGEGIITCTYNNVTGSSKLTSTDTYIDLTLEPSILYINQGKSSSFKINGIDMEGYKGVVSIKDAQWEIDNKELGYFDNGIFIAGTKSGVGNITAKIGDIKINAIVVVGSTTETKTSFEKEEISVSTYPTTAVGSVQRTKEVAYDGTNSIKLSYNLPASEVTQAVYAVFKDIKILDSSEKSLGLQVYGNNNNFLLRGNLVDANKNSFNITFTDNIDFTGWKYLEASLPQNMAYPVTLERIYVASLKTDKPLTGSIYFDVLTTNKVPKTISVKTETPKAPINDPLYLKKAEGYSFKASVIGSTSGTNRLLDKVILNNFIEKANKSNLAIFAGNSKVNTQQITTKNIIWSNKYNNFKYEDIRVITLGTNSGGLIKTDYNQWNKFQTDLKNTPENNIIIVGNRNPINKGSFSDEREAETFHNILKDYQKLTGKNIYYINASGSNFKVNFFEGIRYIDINGLSYNVSGNKVDLNNTFYLLNFYLVNGKLCYDYENLYPLVRIK